MKVVKTVAAEKLHMTVCEECPNLYQLSSYRHAFVTSTSRLVLPISKIILSDGSFVNFATPSLCRSSPPLVDGGDIVGGNPDMADVLLSEDTSLISVLKREVEVAVTARAYNLLR